MNEHRSELARTRASARAWVYMLYFLFVVIIVGTVAIEVTVQALAEQSAPAGSVSCQAGVQALMSALERARAASCKTELREEAAVTAFRAALEPAWRRVDAVRHSCANDADWVEALDAIQHLRYAEENTVRRESSELASLRRRARELLERGKAGPDSLHDRSGRMFPQSDPLLSR
jgi:hypothetical protein